jgi:hypothetical protein
VLCRIFIRRGEQTCKKNGKNTTRTTEADQTTLPLGSSEPDSNAKKKHRNRDSSSKVNERQLKGETCINSITYHAHICPSVPILRNRWPLGVCKLRHLINYDTEAPRRLYMHRNVRSRYSSEHRPPQQFKVSDTT